MVGYLQYITDCKIHGIRRLQVENYILLIAHLWHSDHAHQKEQNRFSVSIAHNIGRNGDTGFVHLILLFSTHILAEASFQKLRTWFATF